MGLRQLLDSLEREARLHLLGRILARSEVQRFLQSRLLVVDTVRRHPEVTQQPVEQPIFITGLGRSGTTFLHEILSQDPRSRVPMLWEAMYPVPPPEAPSHLSRLATLYRRWGKTLSAGAAARMRAAAENRPKKKFGAHAYTFADTGLAVEQERAKYAEYQQAYRVPSEISFESGS